jgi:murein DD-endopeptidase MepM/ murein hydrolase activator NlpD
LGQTRKAARFFDSALFVLRSHSDLAERLPTAYPVEENALRIRAFGMERDPFTGRRGLHAGVDFSLRPGSPVFAAGKGHVVETGRDALWGNYVRLRHTERVETFYAHLQKIEVRRGERVARAEELGSMGQSGVATGPHLHFEMILDGERVDPLRYLLAPGHRQALALR